MSPSQTSLKRRLVGAWSLRSFVMEMADGSVRPWGPEATGILIYSGDGSMAVVMNHKGKSAGPVGNLLAYAGTYKVRGRHVVHYVENATIIDRIGGRERRDIAWRGRDLVLSGTSGFGFSFELVWRRRSTSKRRGPAPAN